MESPSKMPWRALEVDLSADELRGILTVGEQGRPARLREGLQGYAAQTSVTIDAAMALAEAYPGGLGTVAEVLVATGRNTEINHLWAALAYLSSSLPEVAPDAVAWASLARRQGYRRSHPGRRLGASKGRRIARFLEAA